VHWGQDFQKISVPHVPDGVCGKIPATPIQFRKQKKHQTWVYSIRKLDKVGLPNITVQKATGVYSIEATKACAVELVIGWKQATQKIRPKRQQQKCDGKM
jgi:hypothetical protein